MQQAQAQKAPQTQRVRVLRSFYFDRKPIAVNSEIELPSIFAREVIAAKKAEPVETSQPAAETVRKAPQKSLV